MIRAVDGCVLTSLPPRSEAAVRIRCLAEAYGTDGAAFLQFWQGEGGSVLSLMDGAVTLLAGADWEEAGLFVQMHPEAAALRTDRETARRLSALLPGWTLDTGEVMRPAKRFSPSSLTCALPPRIVYPVLAAAFGDKAPLFDGWYVDVSHRLRHGFCRIAAVAEGEEAVAVAMTTAECGEAAVIGGVATLPEKRGRGYASACVSALTAALQAEGKEVFLSPKNEGARRLYEKLGFESAGGWGSLTRV